MSVSNLKPLRRPPTVEHAGRDAAAVSAEISVVEAEKLAGEQELVTLAASYDDAVLQGDVAAQANEERTATLKRAVRRAELRLPMLRAELADLNARDEAQRRADAKIAAEKEVAEFLASFPQEYNRHAAAITKLLVEFGRIADIAKAAGVDGPNNRLRRVPGKFVAEREDVSIVWIDQFGTEHSSPPASVSTPGRPDELPPGWRTERRVKRVPAIQHPDEVRGHILAEIVLPAIEPGQANFFPAP